jgi:hypothetical protein
LKLRRLRTDIPGMVAFLILTTFLALSGLVSVAMAWGVLGGVLYIMQLRARR